MSPARVVSISSLRRSPLPTQQTHPVQSVASGWIDTPLLAPLKNDPAGAQSILDRRTLGRFGQPVELASVIPFLASDAASWVTGMTMPVGGYSALPDVVAV